jgi:hypothetical protein
MDLTDGVRVLRLTKKDVTSLINMTRISNIGDLQTLGDLLCLGPASINVYPWQLTWILGLSKPGSDILLS